MRLCRRARRYQHRERVGFGIERVDLAVALAPVPTDAGRLCQRAAHACRGGELIGRRVAAKYLADFKQAGIGESAIGILLRRRDQAGDQARPHVGEIGGNRVGQRQFGLAAAE